MKQYDKIFIPVFNPDTDFTICSWDNKDRLFVGEQNVIFESNVIVSNIQELRELWSTAKTSPDFPGVLELFLKSKGITI